MVLNGIDGEKGGGRVECVPNEGGKMVLGGGEMEGIPIKGERVALDGSNDVEE
jgi:hypothetical protein